MDDPRGVLAFEFLRLVGEIQPRWFLFENVPGLLSSGGGRDFGAFLGAVAECRYGWAYRILDSAYFGVAQRRRRVFVVGYIGDWRPAAAVLFERESVCGDTETREETGEEIAGSLGSGSGKRGWCSDTERATFVPQQSRCLNARQQRIDGDSETFVAYTIQSNDGGAHKRKDRPFGGMYVKKAKKALTVGSTDRTVVASLMGSGAGTERPKHVAFDMAQITSKTNRTRAEEGLPASTLAKESRMHLAQTNTTKHSLVRRLTPRECERLQGLPDDYTRIPWRGKPAEECPDGPRYRAIGNSMAVPVMAWLGRRIEMADEIMAVVGAAAGAGD
jgi:DNA (cytosine-5)-methyltransferase 1